jgi:hypothetical protein
VSEPFDDPDFGKVTVAEADDAMPLYRRAEAILRSKKDQDRQALRKAWAINYFANHDPEVRRWAEKNRPALEPWLLGADKPDALLVAPRDVTVDTSFEVTQTLRELATLATVEASRLEQSGDFAGAWRYYRGMLRSSRHVGMHGGLLQRTYGNLILNQARPVVKAWAENPAVTSELLRTAIRDVEAAKAMTSPNSEMVKFEYFALEDLLDRVDLRPKSNDEMDGPVDWNSHIPPIIHARQFLRYEPERSRRVHRLVTLGVLAQCDRPRVARPKVVETLPTIYDLDPTTPPALARLTPQELKKWSDGTAYSALTFGWDMKLLALEGEPGTFDDILIAMAERAYLLERGKPPATYGELVGRYLKALPDGFAAGDATFSATAAAGSTPSP